MVAVRCLVPSLVTALTLSLGLAALEATRMSAWDWTLRLILLAAVADGFDGALARLLHATSPLGELLDSLADVIAFGAAPAFLYAAYFEAAPQVVRFGVGLAFVLGGAFRLARYHAEPNSAVFRGLPITAAGALLAIAVAGPFGMELPAIALSAVVLTALMVCHYPFPKLGRSSRSILLFVAAVILAVVLWQLLDTLAVLALVAVVVYMSWGVSGRVAAGLVRRAHSVMHEPSRRKVRHSGQPSP